jgi:hypothetical protein
LPVEVEDINLGDDVAVTLHPFSTVDKGEA